LLLFYFPIPVGAW